MPAMRSFCQVAGGTLRPSRTAARSCAQSSASEKLSVCSREAHAAPSGLIFQAVGYGLRGHKRLRSDHGTTCSCSGLWHDRPATGTFVFQQERRTGLVRQLVGLPLLPSATDLRKLKNKLLREAVCCSGKQVERLRLS